MIQITVKGTTTSCKDDKEAKTTIRTIKKEYPTETITVTSIRLSGFEVRYTMTPPEI